MLVKMIHRLLLPLCFWMRSRIFAAFCILFVLLQQSALAEIDFGIYARSQIGQASTVVQTEQLRAELLAHAPEGLGAGKTLWLGLYLQHQPHWHTYWKNPGDSGLATQLEWTTPPGMVAGPIEWPLPQKIAIGTLANFGYENAVLLSVPFTLNQEFQLPPGGKAVEIVLQASWLVCRQECIPQEGRFVLQLPTQSASTLHAARFEASKRAIPSPFKGKVTAQLTEQGILLSAMDLPNAWQGKALNAFVETPEVTQHAQTPQTSDAVAVGTAQTGGIQGWNNAEWTAILPLNDMRSANPDKLPLVLSLGNTGLSMAPSVEGSWPALKAVNTLSPALQAALDAQILNAKENPPERNHLGTLLLAVASAFLGGLILNLMPCVFPVLAIKILSFATHESTHKAAQRQQGWAYTAGVVLSFVALGGLLWALRAGGELLGWGFQLQSPWVICSLAVLFTLIGLNLMGLLEVGNLLPSGLASLQWRHPVGNAFLSGVLAVAIASPCTAPFMGASLGYALTLPGSQAMAIFAALGLGLAMPYLLLSYFPKLSHKLPRPGAWMDALRRFLAFPMWATVIWLVWVLGHLSGIDSAAILLAFLLSLSMLIWSLQLQGLSRWAYAGIALLLCAGLLTRQPDSDVHSPTADWQAWDSGRVESELLAGRTVFVDFTAAWCITCQYNKKTTLSNDDVLADFAAKKVTLLRADWTRRDPAITLALQALGRSGVPVYVLYQSGKAPLVFSEILTAQELRDALKAL